MKRAVLTMEIEDWYHLDYLDRTRADCAYSLLDGVDQFSEILAAHQIPATFFVLGELASRLGPQLRELESQGHEISSHGWRHTRPSQMSPADFLVDARRSRLAIEDAVGTRVHGYRAPCFDLNAQRRGGLPQAGYAYDNSLIFRQHPTAEVVEGLALKEQQPGIYTSTGLHVFEVSTADLFGRKFPISSAGYYRLFPWPVLQRVFRAYLAEASLYVLYIHPFELSCRSTPKFPQGTRWRDRFRFTTGRGRMRTRLEILVDCLKRSGFVFSTFSAIMSEPGNRRRLPFSRPPAGDYPIAPKRAIG